MAKSGKYILSFVLFMAIALLSQLVHWSDSELWAIGLAREAFSTANPSIDYKLFFNLLLRLVYEFSFTSEQVLNNSRFLFAAFGLLTVFFAQSLARTFSENKSVPIYAVLLLGTSTLFLSQGFKVRSDLLATCLQLSGLLYFLKLKERKTPAGRSGFREATLGIILNILVFLATPKGIYNLLVSFVFLLVLFLQTRQRWIKDYILLTFVAPGLLFCALMLLRLQEFKTAWDFFVASYQESPQHPAFWSLASFSFVISAVINNIHIFGLILLGFIFKRTLWREKFLPLSAATGVSLIIMLVHNDRLPFFLLSQFVFPVLFAAVVLGELKRKALKIGILAFAIINAIFFADRMLREASNQPQRSAQKQIQQYLTIHNSPLYFDATAILPLENKILIFPAPQHFGNEGEVLGVVQKKDLDLIFFGNRLYSYLEPFYQAMEEKYFIQIGPGVFARSSAMRSTSALTPDRWKKICAEFPQATALYGYSGGNFLTMRLHAPESSSCSGPPPRIETKEPFIAFSPYEPLQFESGLSFSQIFDHRPQY